jgi:hypothetical protein
MRASAAGVRTSWAEAKYESVTRSSVVALVGALIALARLRIAQRIEPSTRGGRLDGHLLGAAAFNVELAEVRRARRRKRRSSSCGVKCWRLAWP